MRGVKNEPLNVNNDDFIELWNNSNDARVIASKLNCPFRAINDYATKLRKSGHKLKYYRNLKKPSKQKKSKIKVQDIINIWDVTRDVFTFDAVLKSKLNE